MFLDMQPLLCISVLALCASAVLSQSINFISSSYVVNKADKSLRVDVTRSTSNGSLALGWVSTPGSASGTNTSLTQFGLSVLCPCFPHAPRSLQCF